MNTQLLIQQLKQLPRVGQSGDASKFQTSEEKAAARGQSTQGVGTALIDTAVLTTANALLTELNDNATKFTNLLSLTIKPVEQLNKALGTTTIQSKAIFDNFRLHNETLRSINISDTQRIQQAEALGKIIPGQTANFSKQSDILQNTLDFQTQAVVQAGANQEAVAKLNKLLLSSGENTSDVRDNLLRSARAIELATGETSVFRDMLNAVGAVSSETRQEFRGTTEELAEAAFQATRMGTTLDKVRKSSEGYLNIEQSIQKELEAQLMTGINMASEMNQMRIASFTGDYDEVLRIQNKLIEENFEAIREKGPVAVRSFAASLNLTTEELANQYETITATNAVIQESGKRTLDNLPIKELAETVAKTDESRSSQEIEQGLQKQLDAFKEQVAASEQFQGMDVGDIDLQQILQVPELQESFEQLDISIGAIQDIRDQSAKLTSAQEKVTDAIAGAYSPKSFQDLINTLDDTTNSLFGKIDELLSGDRPKSLSDTFTSLTEYIKGDFKTTMTETMTQATLKGVTKAYEDLPSETFEKRTDAAQASSRK